MEMRIFGLLLFSLAAAVIIGFLVWLARRKFETMTLSECFVDRRLLMYRAALTGLLGVVLLLTTAYVEQRVELRQTQRWRDAFRRALKNQVVQGDRLENQLETVTVERDTLKAELQSIESGANYRTMHEPGPMAPPVIDRQYYPLSERDRSLVSARQDRARVQR
jgi:uncharacterized iron-regulated membrane protein